MAGGDDPKQARHPGRLWTLAFIAALWLAATLFYGGAIGKHSDDYVLSLVDPATGDAPTFINPIEQWGHFWRPVHLTIVYHLGTWLHDETALHHVLGALAYAAAALSAGLLARRIAGSLAGALCAAIVVTFPLNHQVALWTAAISTPLAAAVFMGLALWSLGWSRSARSWSRLWPAPLLGFVIPCLNEQPAAGILALPVLCWFGSGDARGRGRLGTVVRAAAPAAGAGAGAAIYALLYLLDAPEWTRRATLIDPSDLPKRIEVVYGGALSWLAGAPLLNAVKGAWATGIEAVASVEGVVWLVASGALLVGATVQRARDRRPKREGGGTPLAALWFGAALAVCSLLPLAVIRGENITHRVLFLPVMGLAMAASGLVEGVLARVRASAWVRAAAFAVCGLGTMAGATCLVGYQRLYREVWRADQRVAARLGELVERPMISATFIVLENRLQPVRSGVPIFDVSAPSAWSAPWSANRLVHEVYGRKGLGALFCRVGGRPPIFRVTSAHAFVRHPLPASTPTGSGLHALPWERTIPILIEADGGVRIVTDLWIERDDMTDERIALPFVGALAARTGLPRLSRGIAEHPREVEAQAAAAAWTRPGGAPLEFLEVVSWGRTCRAVLLTSGQGVASAKTRLPPSENRRFVAVRVTPWEQRVERGNWGDGCAVVMRAFDTSGRRLAEARVSFAGERVDERWKALGVTIPATSMDVVVRVRIDRSASGAPVHDGVLMTAGTVRTIEEER